MNDAFTQNKTLKAKITEQAGNPRFIHHEWFVKFHLEVVEQIADELCDIYTQANRLHVNNLVWLHDYEKIVDFDHEHNTDLAATQKLMEEVGFMQEAIRAMATQINQYNAKQDLPNAPIEIQIVSSADAASHLVGPFFATYWHDHPDMSFAELQTENTRKGLVDWEQKITLPEIKRAFASRRQFFQELIGNLPSRYLS